MTSFSLPAGVRGATKGNTAGPLQRVKIACWGNDDWQVTMMVEVRCVCHNPIPRCGIVPRR
jgi:hypothetical protein